MGQAVLQAVLSMTVRRQASPAVRRRARAAARCSVGGQRGEQVEALKMKPILSPQLRELLLLSRGDLDAVDADPAAGGWSRPARMRMSVLFAGADGP
jgi:hypothetical protein